MAGALYNRKLLATLVSQFRLCVRPSCPLFLVSGKLEKLEILDCSNNAISSIPDGIRGCAALERLYLNVCCHGNNRLGWEGALCDQPRPCIAMHQRVLPWKR
jgi:hypothetical protein